MPTITEQVNTIKLNAASYAEDMACIMRVMTDTDSVYQSTLNEIDKQFAKLQLTNAEKAKLIVNFMGNIAVAFTNAAGQNAMALSQAATSLELEKARVALQEQTSAADIALKNKEIDVKTAQISIEQAKLASQQSLTTAEVSFNEARTALVEAQTLTEASKKLAVERETESYNDQLRIKEAETLKDAVFAYASGGVTVPADLQSTMLTAVGAITPNN